MSIQSTQSTQSSFEDISILQNEMTQCCSIRSKSMIFDECEEIQHQCNLSDMIEIIELILQFNSSKNVVYISCAKNEIMFFGKEESKFTLVKKISITGKYYEKYSSTFFLQHFVDILSPVTNKKLITYHDKIFLAFKRNGSLEFTFFSSFKKDCDIFTMRLMPSCEDSQECRNMSF